MYARPFIDSLDFARNNQEICGEVQIAKLPRLLDVLENLQGILSYTVQGGVDSLGSYFLDISVVGQCRLLCQRCLNGMDYPVRLNTRLLLRDQTSLDALDDSMMGAHEMEPDSILADTHLNVLELLEEEILLNLPIAPKHELGACQMAVGNDTHGDKKNPFAILAKLKSN